MNKTFPLHQVLSITTGILLGEMDEVYEILDYMTGGPVWTHQLPRAAKIVKPIILEQHPILKSVDESDFQKEHWQEWLDKQRSLFPAEYELIPMNNWEHRDPIEEAVEMVGEDKVVVVKI